MIALIKMRCFVGCDAPKKCIDIQLLTKLTGKGFFGGPLCITSSLITTLLLFIKLIFQSCSFSPRQRERNEKGADLSISSSKTVKLSIINYE